MQTDGRTTHPGAEGITTPPVTSGILGLSEETLQHLLPFHLIWDNGGQLDRISDALKRAWREQPWPQYLQAYVTVRERFQKGELPAGVV